MIRNWLLTALRGFRKNKTSSAINILGLTVGLSSCLLIMLFIRHEMSYDDFEVRGNRIARVIMGYRFNGGGEVQWINATSTKVATTFQRTFPEIEAAVRMTERGDKIAFADQRAGAFSRDARQAVTRKGDRRTSAGDAGIPRDSL